MDGLEVKHKQVFNFRNQGNAKSTEKEVCRNLGGSDLTSLF